MQWTLARLKQWYATPAGVAAAARLAKAVGRLPLVRWVGSLRPMVLEVGCTPILTQLWPNALVEDGENALADDAAGHSECRFDRIVVAHVLEQMHGRAQEALLERCWLALRPDGTLVVVVPDGWSWRRWAWLGGEGPLTAGKGYGAGELETLLREAGFKEITTACAGGFVMASGRKDIAGTRALRRKAVGSSEVEAVPVGLATLVRR